MFKKSYLVKGFYSNLVKKLIVSFKNVCFLFCGLLSLLRRLLPLLRLLFLWTAIVQTHLYDKFKETIQNPAALMKFMIAKTRSAMVSSLNNIPYRACINEFFFMLNYILKISVLVVHWWFSIKSLQLLKWAMKTYKDFPKTLKYKSSLNLLKQ